MKFNEYKRELKLMRKQYGQEEELYPLINILLRETIICDTDVSIRAVAGARHAEKAAPGWKLFSGGGKGFPDIAILSTSACMNEYTTLTEDCIDCSKNYLYGCVEAKKVGAQLLEFKEFNEDDKSGVIYVSYERKIQKRLNEAGKFNCYTLNLNKPDIPQNFLKKFSKSEDWIILKDCEEEGWEWDVEENYKRTRTSKNDVKYRIHEVWKITFKDNAGNKREISHQEDVLELLNEIIWYENVLYTNGTVWKYLELKSVEVEDYKEWKCEKAKIRLEYFNGGEILEKIKTITIKCFTICNLDLNASDEVNKKEWNRLKTNLSIINWTGETKFEKFK